MEARRNRWVKLPNLFDDIWVGYEKKSHFWSHYLLCRFPKDAEKRTKQKKNKKENHSSMLNV